MQSLANSDTDSRGDDLRWYLLQDKVYEARICQAFRIFRSNGIEPVLIKGWAAARYYPDSHLRTYTDIDLGVPSSSFDRAVSLLRDEEANKLNIDLHCEFRHLDTLRWEELVENSELIFLNGTGIRILSAEDHLRVLTVHWLTDSGADKERLWDIYYAVENRPASFDWAKCLEPVTATRKKWVICTIGLAHKYLGLEIEGLPFAREAADLPLWLTKSIEREWRLGIPLRGLYDSLHDWRFFFAQLKKRIPPNAVYSTIECEGEFDDRARLPYQLRSLFRRMIPGLRKISTVLRAGWKDNAKRD